MNTKTKNLITSIVGLILMLTGVVFYVLSKKFEFDFSLVELTIIEALGLLLLWAWNALLQKFVRKTLRL